MVLTIEEWGEKGGEAPFLLFGGRSFFISRRLIICGCFFFDCVLEFLDFSLPKKLLLDKKNRILKNDVFLYFSP